MPKNESQKKKTIPKFKNRENEARFWDTHDFTEYTDELKPARVRFAKNLSEGITIRLDLETLSILRSEARQKGVGPTTLARMWILEHLREHAGHRPSDRGAVSEDGLYRHRQALEPAKPRLKDSAQGKASKAKPKDL